MVLGFLARLDVLLDGILLDKAWLILFQVFSRLERRLPRDGSLCQNLTFDTTAAQTC